MLKATIHSLLSRKLRLVLSGFAVVLGVMAVTGSMALTDSLEKSYDALFRTVDTRSDVIVTASPKVDTGQIGARPYAPPIPADVVSKVAAMSGVEKALGDVMVDGARVVGPDGKVIPSQNLPRFGSAWHGTSSLIELRQGRGPKADDEVAINAGLAKVGNFKVGSSIQVLTLNPKRTFTVVGIFGYAGNRDSLRGETVVSFTEPVAQDLMLGQKAAYSTINVTAKKGISPTKLRDDVRRVLGGGYKVKTGQEVAAENAGKLKDFLNVVRNILLGFAGVTLFVGTFLIINTFSILIAQRTKELALFRALGASRNQVLGSVLIEATVIGLIASTVGILAGFGLSVVLRIILESSGGSKLPSPGAGIPLAPIVAGYITGILTTVTAAMLPARRASRIPPVAAWYEAATPDRPLTMTTIVGGIPTACGVAGVVAALFIDLGAIRMWTLIGGALLAFVGISMLTPSISRPAVSILGRPLTWSIVGKLGHRNSARNPRRTAITAATLMIGIALVTCVSVLGTSLRVSLDQLTRQDMQAQLVIAGDPTSNDSPTFDPSVLDQVRAIRGIRGVTAFYFDIGSLGSAPIFLQAGDPDAIKQVFTLKTQRGELRTLKHGELVVDGDFAKSNHLSVGQKVDLTTQRGGQESYVVVGIYKTSPLQSGPILSADDAIADFTDPNPAQALITLRPGVNADAVKRKVTDLLKDNPEVSVRTTVDLTRQIADQVVSFETNLYVLLALTIVIAVLGIVNTLALSILERTRELGLLRAVGLLRSQLAKMVTVESVVISVFGTLLGVLVGCGLGMVVVRALHDQGVPTLALPWERIMVILVLAVVVGLLAAVSPAIRAARTNVLQAISYE